MLRDATVNLEPPAKTATTGATDVMASTAPPDTKVTRATPVIKALPASKASVAPRVIREIPDQVVLQDLRVYQAHAAKLAPTARMAPR